MRRPGSWFALYHTTIVIVVLSRLDEDVLYFVSCTAEKFAQILGDFKPA
jgi:hypothetical protein